MLLMKCIFFSVLQHQIQLNKTRNKKTSKKPIKHLNTNVIFLKKLVTILIMKTEKAMKYKNFISKFCVF